MNGSLALGKDRLTRSSVSPRYGEGPIEKVNFVTSFISFHLGWFAHDFQFLITLFHIVLAEHPLIEVELTTLDRTFTHPIRYYSLLVNPEALSLYLFGPEHLFSKPSESHVVQLGCSLFLALIFSFSFLFMILTCFVLSFSDMFTQQSKVALVRVSVKNPNSTSHKCPKFSQLRSIERGKLSEALAIVSIQTTLAFPSIINLEAVLEFTPKFKDCMVDLPLYVLSKSSVKGKEKALPSLLQDEDQEVAHLCSSMI